MQPTPDQLGILAGVVASLVVKLLKRIPGFKATPAVTKQLTAAALAILGSGFACGWHLGGAELTAMAWAILSALLTHSLVLGPLEKDAEERAAVQPAR